jgi:hypothetical protein
MESKIKDIVFYEITATDIDIIHKINLIPVYHSEGVSALGI